MELPDEDDDPMENTEDEQTSPDMVADELPETAVEYEVQPHVRVLKVVNSNDTRWNSTLAMIARLLTLEHSIR